MKLVESFRVNSDNIKKIPLTEETRIVEKDGTKYKCRAAYELPVWRLNEKNLNERIYGKELADKLMKENPTTLGLANHPKDDADVTYTFAVERNPHIRENIMYVDAYLVGENGELANEIIEAGGSIGLSSSAYGDVDKDGRVKEEDFTIERYADWVDMPSYEVYAKKEDSLNKNKEVEEVTFEKNNTNIMKEKDEKENFDMSDKLKDKDNKLLSIEEKNFKMGIKKRVQEAETKEDLQEKREAFREVLEYCEGIDFADDYKNKAQEEIQKIENQIIELANKGKEVDSLKENSEKTKKELQEKTEKLEQDLKTVTEKYDKAVELLDDMKEREAKLKELYEDINAQKNGMITASEYKEAVKYAESKDEEIEEIQRENTKLKKRIRTIMERSQFKEFKKKDNKKEINEKKDIKEDELLENDLDEQIEEENYKEKKNSIYNFSNNEEVQNYYESLVYRNPNIKKIKEEILGCKTKFEAQKKYLNLRDLIEDVHKPDPISKKLAESNDSSYNYHPSFTVRKGWD